MAEDPNIPEQEPKVLVKQTSAGYLQIDTADDAEPNQIDNNNTINNTNENNLQQQNDIGLSIPPISKPKNFRSPEPTPTTKNDLNSFTAIQKTNLTVIKPKPKPSAAQIQNENNNNNNKMTLPPLNMTPVSSYDPEPLHVELGLKSIDGLQPDELIKHIHECFGIISSLDESEAVKINYIKNHLQKANEKLKLIKKAIISIDELEKTRELLPKHPLTNFITDEGLDIALREHHYFAQSLGLFGMLIIEVCDMSSIRDEFGLKFGQKLLSKMLKKISHEFIEKHMLFEVGLDKLVVLVYVIDDRELFNYGNEFIELIGSTNFNINGENLQSSVSVGGAICVNKAEFDFRKWSLKCENALQKAKQLGSNKCCVLNYEDDTKNNKNDDGLLNSLVSSPQKRKHPKHKSSFSIFATKANASSTNKNNTLQLTSQQVKLSLKLFDKINTIIINNINNKEKLILSLIIEYNKQKIQWNFQHPKYNGNTILMYFCSMNKPMNIIIKYFIVKIWKKIKFGFVDNNGNNCLMLYVCNKRFDINILKMLAKRTLDKTTKNKDGKTAKDLAEEMKLDEDIIEFLT